jgi:hypothetical protein
MELKPIIKAFVDDMISKKIYLKKMRFKEKNEKVQRFLEDLQPAVANGMLYIKFNVLDENLLEIRLNLDLIEHEDKPKKINLRNI